MRLRNTSSRGPGRGACKTVSTESTTEPEGSAVFSQPEGVIQGRGMCVVPFGVVSWCIMSLVGTLREKYETYEQVRGTYLCRFCLSRLAAGVRIPQTTQTKLGVRFFARREAVVRNRKAKDANKGGGYTDLEVLEVLNPGKAARIRLRQARYSGKHHTVMERVVRQPASSRVV